jgi:hypothetical protein
MFAVCDLYTVSAKAWLTSIGIVEFPGGWDCTCQVTYAVQPMDRITIKEQIKACRCVDSINVGGRMVCRAFPMCGLEHEKGFCDTTHSPYLDRCCKKDRKKSIPSVEVTSSNFE